MLATELKPFREEKCTFCGQNKAGGAWMGAQLTVFCCGECAHDVLPQFIADSIVGSLSSQQIESSSGATIKITKEDKILNRFHSAFASALIRKARKHDC